MMGVKRKGRIGAYLGCCQGCPQRKGTLWTGGDVPGLDGSWWFSAKEQHNGYRGGEDSDSTECRVCAGSIRKLLESQQGHAVVSLESRQGFGTNLQGIGPP